MANGRGGATALGNPDDMRERLTFFAANQSLFLVWLFAAIGLWIFFIAMMPAIWRALGRGWAATAVVLALFVGAAVNLAGDGGQFPTIFLSTRYAGAAESLRPGLEAAASEVSTAASTLLMPGIIPFFIGSLGAAPVGPPVVAAVLNLLFFAVIAYLTERGLASEGASKVT